MCTTERNKWLLFCCRSAQDKVKWLEGFVKERKLVEQDLKDGLEFAPAARHLARIAATRCRRPPSKPTSKIFPIQIIHTLLKIISCLHLVHIFATKRVSICDESGWFDWVVIIINPFERPIHDNTYPPEPAKYGENYNFNKLAKRVSK